MSNAPTDPPDSAHANPEAAQPDGLGETQPVETPGNTAAGQETPSSAAGETPPDDTPQRRRILIGSQRNPDAYRPKPKRDWEPINGPPKQPTEQRAEAAVEEPPADAAPTAAQAEPEAQAQAPPTEPAAAVEPPSVPAPAAPLAELDVEMDEQNVADLADAGRVVEEMGPMPSGRKKFPPPSKRGELPPDLEKEFQQALAGTELDDLLRQEAAGDQASGLAMLDAGSTHTGRVVAVRRDDIFIELGGREQGVVPLKQFAEPPEIGAPLEVRVVRFNQEEGLYELSLPGAAAEVGDWSDLEEGMMVEARVTGHNSGGLECEVNNHIRGFIPISQIALWRVENLAEFVDEKFTCLVTEANPDRRNLVLSRRAVLEREKEEGRRNLLEALAPGQIREGVVRKLMAFGAFVDLGGVDGLLHVSQLSWARVNHPSDVLQEGQAIKVRVDKVDATTGRISLAYRDMLENPWTDAPRKYPPTSTVKGKVSKLMEFGAFVELEPGVEGLVHISELSHKRVWRVSDVVKEGDEVEVVVLSVDPEAQRISLSMKDALPKPEPEKQKEPSGPEPPQKTPPKKPSGPLKGGLGRSPLGEQFGLKW